MTIDMFSVAPRLETVVFDNVNDLNSRYIRIPVIVPFHQLSSYVRKIVPYSRGELKTSLADFSNLVHFETSWECTVGQLEPRITFPRLKILVIFFCDGNIHPSGGFFERLILPCIREIIVRGQADGVTLAISSMISQRLPCNLRILSITTLENPSDLRSLLLLTPRLKDLRIRLSSRLDLVNLLATSERPPLLPKLHSLCVVLPAQFIPSFSSPLATFIATRVEMPNARAGFCIETLQLSFLTEFACRAAYFAVQPFPQVGELDSNVLALVNSWKKRLVEEIPHLSHNPTPQTMLINRLMHWRRLHQLFNAIEGYDIPTSGYLHVRDFFRESCVLTCKDL
jgi:hypothetical protein